MNSPLKYHGGKRYLVSEILAVMPRHLVYVEPFFGAGQVFFARDPRDPRYFWPGRTSDGRKADGVAEVVNDRNPDLMNFYGVLKDPGLRGPLIERLSLTLHSEREWQAAGELLDSGGGGAVDRAAALFVLVRQSMSGRMTNYAPVVRTRLRGGREDGVNGWWKKVEGLEEAHQRLKQARVLNRPALELLRKEDTPATLFYLDPPYLHETRTARRAYGLFEMTDDDHRELLGAITSPRLKGKVILSGYGNDLYDRALSRWSSKEVQLPNNASSAKSKRGMTEVLWWNF
jgi:DNA adenine methylase